jgi:hypothetical protein
MKIIAGKRRTGRTTELIKLAAKSEANKEVCYIVCCSQPEAYRIAQKAKELELNIGFPITYDEFLREEYYGVNIHHFYIDNAEDLLAYISKVPIEAITITEETKIDNYVWVIAYDHNECYGVFKTKEEAEKNLEEQIAAGGPAWEHCQVEKWVIN